VKLCLTLCDTVLKKFSKIGVEKKIYIAEMLPDEFLNRLDSQKYIDKEALLEALEGSSPVSIRINPSKWNKKPLSSEPVPWCKTGYYLDTRPSYTLDPLFHSGCYYPQEASSMFLEQVFNQVADYHEKLKVLDLCGAPGGKSTHLSHLIGPDNLLVSNEVIRSRAVILAETVTKWGSGNTLVTQNDPARFSRLSGYFDIILLDAPCSGEGMFRSKTAVDEWSVDNTVHSSERQKRILMDVWPALKENGILIYSTCTFNPGENEENIKWLTGKHEAESLQINIADFAGINEIDFQGIYGYGFYPGKVRGEGFFISALRKTGKQEKAVIKGHKKAESKPAKRDLEVAEKWTIFSKDRLLKWGDELLAVSGCMEDYIQLFQNLRVVKAGTKIFVVKKNDYLPAHELAISVNLRTKAFPVADISLNEAIAYLRRDNFVLHDTPKGWNILTYMGVNLGFVNNIGNRVNNYFPVEWRIRMDLPERGNENILKWSQ
jgi:16S rRNA C967 or C1407 C5-methylase (RsmB/RsmF family)/NOL1/NOP2/fmu family ribosome biogenesis protein